MDSNLQPSPQVDWTVQEKKTITILDDFVIKMQDNKLASNPQMVVDKIGKWSNSQQPDCIKMICTFILTLTKENRIIEDKEEQRVDELVKNLLNNWQENDHSQHLKEIENNIINHNRGAFILKYYRQIIQRKPVDVNKDSSEQMELVNLGLVTVKDNIPKISNLIYEKAFSINWITETLKNKRPAQYSEKFQRWKDSNQKDQDSYYLGIEHLLNGQELDNAIKWMQDLTLEEVERKYLIRSQVFDLRGTN